MPGTDLQALETKLGHSFRDRNLLVRALTHRSYAFDNKSTEDDELDNERLEFLGDSILGFVVSESLVVHHAGWLEGRLSKAKAHLVSATHLHKVACTLDLGRFLQLGRGEEMSGGRQKKMLLANAVEAIIAALHLDAGLDVAKRFVVENIVADFDAEALAEEHESNYKSTLQERAQAVQLPPPHYVIVDEVGPGHAKTFTVEARVGSAYSSQGTGSSKKSAAQRAAKAILQAMDESPASE